MKSLDSRFGVECRLHWLEFVRFLSALAVLFWHYQHFFYSDIGRPDGFDPEVMPLYSIFSWLYDYGYWGVQVFWCLSGYVFYWKYAADISGRGIGFSRFFIYRFSRLYPLHFLTLIFVGIGQLFFFKETGHYFVYGNNDFEMLLKHLFLAGSWFGDADSFNGPIWSVSVELLVYFVFFFLVFLFGNVLFSLFVGIFSGCLFWFLNVKHPVVGCLFFFFLGGWAWFFSFRLDFVFVRWLCGIALFLLIGVWISSGWALVGSKGYLFFVVALPCILVLFSKLSVGDFWAGMFDFFGSLTYSSYLLHFPLQLIFVLFGFDFFKSTYFFLFYFGFLFFISFVFYRFYELPAQRLIRKTFAY